MVIPVIVMMGIEPDQGDDIAHGGLTSDGQDGQERNSHQDGDGGFHSVDKGNETLKRNLCQYPCAERV